MEDNGIKVDVKADLTPILEATPKGLSYFYYLIFGKKHAASIRRLRLANAQDQIDVGKILSHQATYNHLSDNLLVSSPIDIKEAIKQSIQDEEVNNLIMCSIKASNNIEEQDGEIEEPPEDFINRWRSEARLISEELAQLIWGKILAEEINSPNSISLRTLDVIKNLNKKEAEAFAKAAKFVVFNNYIIDNKDDNGDLPSSSFETLRDAGLINSYSKGFYNGSKWPKTSVTINGITKEHYYLQCGDIFIYAENTSEDQPSFTYWTLTQAARELYKVIDVDIDSSEIEKIVNYLIKDGRDKIKSVRYTKYTDKLKTKIDIENIKEIKN